MSFRRFSTAAQAGELELLTADIGIFRHYQDIRSFLAGCDAVYANCGPWAALLYLVREREQLDVRIIREVRTVGWVGYIWQEEVAGQLERPGDQRVFPSRYARDIWDAAAPANVRIARILSHGPPDLRPHPDSGSLQRNSGLFQRTFARQGVRLSAGSYLPHA